MSVMNEMSYCTGYQLVNSVHQKSKNLTKDDVYTTIDKVENQSNIHFIS